VHTCSCAGPVWIVPSVLPVCGEPKVLVTRDLAEIAAADRSWSKLCCELWKPSKQIDLRFFGKLWRQPNMPLEPLFVSAWFDLYRPSAKHRGSGQPSDRDWGFDQKQTRPKYTSFSLPWILDACMLLLSLCISYGLIRFESFVSWFLTQLYN